MGNRLRFLQYTPKGVGQRFRDFYFDKPSDHAGVRGAEVYHSIVLGSSLQLAPVLLGSATYQDGLYAADHPAADGESLLIYASLQDGKPLLFDLQWSLIRQFGCRGAWPRTEYETVGLVKTDLFDEFHGGIEVLFGLPWKSYDQIR